MMTTDALHIAITARHPREAAGSFNGYRPRALDAAHPGLPERATLSAPAPGGPAGLRTLIWSRYAQLSQIGGITSAYSVWPFAHRCRPTTTITTRRSGSSGGLTA